MAIAPRVYDYSDEDAAVFAQQIDELQAGLKLLNSVIDASKALESETSLLWLSYRLEQALSGLADWLPQSACTRSAWDVEDCSTGDGPLADLLHGLITCIELAERYGAEGRALRFILSGMKALAARLDDALVNDREARSAPPMLTLVDRRPEAFEAGFPNDKASDYRIDFRGYRARRGVAKDLQHRPRVPLGQALRSEPSGSHLHLPRRSRRRG